MQTNLTDRTTLIDDLVAYVRRNAISFIVLYIVMFALWGTWLVKDIVTFDAEGLYSSAFSKDWYSQWLSLGRWMLVALKSALDVIAINPYFSNAVLFVAFPISMILWSFALERWYGKEMPMIRMLFFGIYVSHPIWALLFSYRLQMEVMTITMCMLPIGAVLLSDWLEKKTALSGFLAFILVVCSFGSYQSFMFLFADACVIYMLLRMKKNRDEEWRSILRTAIKIGIFMIGAFVCWYIISRLACAKYNLSYGDKYLMDQFMWGKRSAKENINAIVQYIQNSMFGNGYEFNAIYGTVSLLFFAKCAINLIKREAHSFLELIAAICIWIVPYVLEIVTAGNVVVRSQYAFVLSCSFMAAADAVWIGQALKQFRRSIRQTAYILFGVVLLLPQMQITTRLLYTDVRVMEQDLRMFDNIYERAMSMGAQETYAIYFDGGHGNTVDESLLETEVVGFSYFEFCGMNQEQASSKAAQAMRAYGYNVLPPTKHQIEIGAEIAKDLKLWPEEDSLRVLKEERLIVVNLDNG